MALSVRARPREIQSKMAASSPRLAPHQVPNLLAPLDWRVTTTASALHYGPLRQQKVPDNFAASRELISI